MGVIPSRSASHLLKPRIPWNFSTWIRPKKDSSRFSDIETQPSETFVYVWFDKNFRENLQIQTAVKLFKQNMKDVRVMDDRYKFEQWLMRHHTNENIVLIISNECATFLVPDIHSSQLIIAIYVYYADENTDHKWMESYSKVRSVIFESSKILQQVSMDMKDFEHTHDFNSQCVLTHNDESSRVEDISEQMEDSQGGMC